MKLVKTLERKDFAALGKQVIDKDLDVGIDTVFIKRGALEQLLQPKAC